jgi:hypothetical protein
MEPIFFAIPHIRLYLFDVDPTFDMACHTNTHERKEDTFAV